MTSQNYTRVKAIVTVVLAAVTAGAIVRNTYGLPLVLFAAGTSLLWYLRRLVTDVIEDERDRAVGGNAALLVLQGYSWTMTAAASVLFAMRFRNPAYEVIASTLSFCVCLILAAYWAIHAYYRTYAFRNTRVVYVLCCIIAGILIMIGGIRLFSGEDDWMCRNGEWVRHGNPSFPAPAVPCR